MKALEAYAKNEFFLSSTIKGSKAGTTQRQHLEQVQKARKTPSPELEQSKNKPKALGYLWDWFSNFLMWNSPLTFQELQAWSNLTGVRVTPIEAEILFTLDKHYRNQKHG